MCDWRQDEINQYPNGCRVITKFGPGMVLNPEYIEEYISYHWTVLDDPNRPKHKIWSSRWAVLLDETVPERVYFRDGIGYFWRKDLRHENDRTRSDKRRREEDAGESAGQDGNGVA